MRIEKEEFKTKPLRVHEFLSDVPLHDVWVFHLHGGENRTLADFRVLLNHENAQDFSIFVSLLFRLRATLGCIFGWDEERKDHPAKSYISFLTDAERRRSLIEPGSTTIGSFRAVYCFSNEALDEIINATVHSFSLLAMEPSTNGYTVYWAIYVKPLNWFTPVYMALIDPFRHIFVYPAIIKKIEGAWAKRYQTSREA